MAGPSQRRLSKASRGRRTLTDTDDDALRFGFVTDPEQANDRLCHRLAGLLLGRFRRRFLVKRRYLRNPAETHPYGLPPNVSDAPEGQKNVPGGGPDLLRRDRLE
jgi:hypothetical protein